MQTSAAVVQRQLDAYNAHDLEAFVACHAVDAKIFRMPSSTPAISGTEELRRYYATERFSIPALRAEILNRIVVGDKVVDHERVFGLAAEPVEVAVVYEVIGGLIRTVWFYDAGSSAPGG